jgi:hypothetical protein
MSDHEHSYNEESLGFILTHPVNIFVVGRNQSTGRNKRLSTELRLTLFT